MRAFHNVKVDYSHISTHVTIEIKYRQGYNFFFFALTVSGKDFWAYPLLQSPSSADVSNDLCISTT